MSDANSESAKGECRPQAGVPPTSEEREGLRREAAEYVRRHGLCAPLAIDELKQHATALLELRRCSPGYVNFASVLINNALWHDTVAAIPFQKRLLLMPQCLRSAETCPAECDEIGLLCRHCGACIIHDFKRQAEDLGYAVLIAEGSPIVMSLIETGQIEAIVGVSCLHTLEKVFPYMEAGAVPGIAVPLLYNGCRNTAIDTDWLWEAVYEFSGDGSTPRLDLTEQRERVDAWFTESALEPLLQTNGTRTEALALEWMARAGKRWRPFLTACTHAALAPQGTASEGDVQRASVAIECFHKASLIHDDIEDNDGERYGKETLHTAHGIPIALNVGDLLIGWGYQLLAELDVPAQVRIRMIRSAAHAHRVLCLGQGEELIWARRPGILAASEVVEIFRQKTSPAFEVALHLGALLAGADDDMLYCLHQYSDALGEAYQIRDDLEDYLGGDEDRRHLLDRPSIVTALAAELASGPDRDLLSQVLQNPLVRETEFPRMIALFGSLQIERQVRDLLEQTKTRAVDSLMTLKNPALKSLLRRVVGKIFGDLHWNA